MGEKKPLIVLVNWKEQEILVQHTDDSVNRYELENGQKDWMVPVSVLAAIERQQVFGGEVIVRGAV